MTAPTTIMELVERFHRNRDAYRSGHYNETQVRHEFIDPFFIALGWDVNNIRAIRGSSPRPGLPLPDLQPQETQNTQTGPGRSSPLAHFVPSVARTGRQTRRRPSLHRKRNFHIPCH